MQCANLLRKRSLEAERETWSCSAKRACLEAEFLSPECPMETSHAFTPSNQQPRLQGHINHIMGH
ncbi:uncharacterized protein V6R79_004377 [Siganus canaliculatus]